MVSANLPNDVCTENAYRKFKLQVYADPGGSFTIFPINIVTNIVQSINIVQIAKFSQSTGWLVGSKLHTSVVMAPV